MRVILINDPRVSHHRVFQHKTAADLQVATSSTSSPMVHKGSETHEWKLFFESKRQHPNPCFPPCKMSPNRERSTCRGDTCFSMISSHRADRPSERSTRFPRLFRTNPTKPISLPIIFLTPMSARALCKNETSHISGKFFLDQKTALEPFSPSAKMA